MSEQPASAPHMPRIVPHTVPRVGRSYGHFSDGFELLLLIQVFDHEPRPYSLDTYSAPEPFRQDQNSVYR